MLISQRVEVYLHIGDQSAVDEFVKRELNCMLMLDRATDPRSFETDSSTSGGACRFICPRPLASEVKPSASDVGSGWYITAESGPLIEWRFSKLHMGILYPGIFCYLSRPPSDVESALNPEFARVAVRTFRWIRNYAPMIPTEWGQKRLGPIAAQMLRAGEIALRDGP